MITVAMHNQIKFYIENKLTNVQTNLRNIQNA